MCALAREANRCVLENATAPQEPSLSEADVAEVEGFLDEMLLIYPVLGLSAFEKPEPTKTAARRYYLRARGVEAQGYEDPNGFVVLAGSQVARDYVPSAQGYLVTMRAALQQRGVIVQNGDGLKMGQDYTFDSPSTAAGVVLGRSSNGRVEWKDADGRTLKENQTAAVGSNSTPTNPGP
jgi:hypothetical protein